MRKTKRRMETLSFYDHTGIVAHLERMAAKGWMLERIANYGWIYRRIEPKKLHFGVSYYAKASEYDPKYPESQQTFHDFCAHTGWQLVCTSFQMQVFCNEQEDPVPIETDPVLEVETIHASMMKHFFWGHVVLLVLSVVMEFLFLMGILGNMVAALADPMKVFSGFCWLLVFVLALTELTAYFRWHKKAEEAALQGQFLDTPNTALVQKTAMFLLYLAGAYLVVHFVAEGNTMMLFILGGMAVFMGLTFFTADAIKGLFKKWGMAKNTNRIVSFLLTWFVAFMAMNLVTFGTVALKNQGFFDQKQESAEARYPLRVEDLMNTEHRYVTEDSSEESIFLSSHQIRQHPRFDVEDWSEIPHMEYDLVKVKWDFLYEDVRAQMIKDILRETDQPMEPTDAAPWGAMEAYRAAETRGERYLLCYEDTIVDILFSWPLAPEQMRVVGEKLG